MATPPSHSRPLHRHPRHIHKDHEEKSPFADRMADRVAAALGSWRGLGIMTLGIVLWIGYNAYAAIHYFHTRVFDPAPFILLNLIFSTQAFYAAPIILMSSNRIAAVDRAHAENAYAQVAEVLRTIIGLARKVLDIAQATDRSITILEDQNRVLEEQNRTMLSQHAEITRHLAALADRLAALEGHVTKGGL